MKVFIDCGCAMLQKTLEMFLGEFITSYDKCDMILSDEEKQTQKPLFLIGGENSDLKIPFDKDTLISKLFEYDKILKSTANFENFEKKFENLDEFENMQSPNLANFNSNSLEDRISDLIDNFKDELIKIIKESKN